MTAASEVGCSISYYVIHALPYVPYTGVYIILDGRVELPRRVYISYQCLSVLVSLFDRLVVWLVGRLC